MSAHWKYRVAFADIDNPGGQTRIYGVVEYFWDGDDESNGSWTGFRTFSGQDLDDLRYEASLMIQAIFDPEGEPLNITGQIPEEGKPTVSEGPR